MSRRRMHGGGYDVIVAGGGAGGVGAAVTAARAGARTLLIDSGAALGGAAACRGVVTYCGLYTFAEPPRAVASAVAAEVLARLRRLGAVSEPQRHRGVFVVFDPEANKLVLDEVCADAGVEVRLHTTLIDAERGGGLLRSLTLYDHGGRRVVTGRAFVDATGDANLAALAGASTRYGNDGAANLASLATRFGGVAADVTVDAARFAAAVERRRRAGDGPFSKDRGVVCRLPLGGDLVVYMASADYDPRDAAALSRAEADGRRQAQAYLRALRTLPGCERAYLVATGPQFGTRESRHLNCRYRLCWDDVVARRSFDDAIAYGAWGAEWHDRKTFASTMDAPPGRDVYQIPFGCLHSADTANLFAAGRTADADRKAGAAIRVMGTAFATGAAAGAAAALCRDGGAVDVARVRRLSGFGHAAGAAPAAAPDAASAAG